MTIACLLPLLFHAIIVVAWILLRPVPAECLMLFAVTIILAALALSTSFQMGSTIFQFRRNEASLIFVSCFFFLLLMFAILFPMLFIVSAGDQRAIIQFAIATLAPLLLSFNVTPLCWNLTANRMNNNFTFVDKKVWQPVDEIRAFGIWSDKYGEKVLETY